MSSTRTPSRRTFAAARTSTPRRLLGRRSVQLTVLAWLAAVIVVLATAGDALPFDWPDRGTGAPSVSRTLIDVHLVMPEILLLSCVVWWLTRRRIRPDLAERAPERTVALRETLLLLGYGAAALALGYAVAPLFGWHPFGLHLAGTLYGTHEHVSPAEAIAWAHYNVIVYAVVPLVYFRSRYRAEDLGLVSTDRRSDARVIGVVLAIEAVVQYFALRPEIFDLGARQLAIGVPLTFVLYLAGAVLPAMVFIHAILVPRFMRLTGSVASTVILGGLMYAVLHVWDAWTVFDTPGDAVLSVVFLLFTYFLPGMFKTVLTVRTGNAWVHVWAYHAFAPHTLADTPHVVHVFGVE
ncbi:hypothetical protein [Embleya sp. NPDC050493]|uniref:hypothetical protein n=1 Tax=Embleya sp. NPDC050493 TaxID=3363989 RepID=UPI00378CDF42